MSPRPLCECSACTEGETRSFLLGEEEISLGNHSVIPRRSDSEPAPLSFAQERIWLLSQLQPGGYLTRQFGIRLCGELEIAALEMALNLLLSRHEVLRTCFRSGIQVPRQMVLPLCEIEMPMVDLTDWPESQREGVAARLAEHEGAKAFDLAVAPLLRAKLLRLREDDHLLVLSAHQIIMDASSQALFIDELLHLYGKGQPPELPIQYADFSEWQRMHVRGRLFNRELRYWKNRLEGAPLLLELPSDRIRPAVKSYRGARVPIRVNPELTEKLRAVGQREECTLFMTLLAAFQALVHRYTGCDDIVVGAPLANRNRREVEGLIGCFANTMALRTGMSGNPTFRELLARVRRTTRGALAHQELPFEKLVEKLELTHDPSFAPLFQLLFDFDCTAPLPQCPAELKITSFEVHGGSTEYDLTIHLRDDGQELSGWIEYATDLFDRQTIERFAGHYETLLAGVVSNPKEHLSRLPLLTEAEQEWQRKHFMHDTEPSPPGLCVHELIREQVAIRPDAVALECGDRQISYAELDRRSDQLLQILSASEIGSEDLVAVCLDRSVEMAVAVLGILKAGAAYLPLNPDTPPERLVHMLREARPHALITMQDATRNLSFRRSDAGDFDPGMGLPMIYLDAELWEDMACEEPRRPWSCAGPENVACVLYTDDPAGDPAGVQIPHRALSNLIASLQEQLGISDQDTLLAIAPIESGRACVELLLPLVAGARVMIAGDTSLSSGMELRQLFERVRPTLMQAPPSIWRSLLIAGWQGHSTLKILCGGEAWADDLAEALLRRCGSLWNVYGTAETTVWQAITKVESPESLTIGSPLPNTSFHILDPHHQPVPIGVPGELYVGGDGVALGYLDRPELNARVFVANVLQPDSQRRLYRTGDRVRYRPEGGIEFLGHMNSLSRIRGFDVQPRAIEAVLRSHPGVAQAAVTICEEPPADQCLMAYIVPAANPPVSSAELRQFLRHALPEYMVPSAMVLRDELPVIPGGRMTCESLSASLRLVPSQTAEPRNELEKTIQEIWREILGTPKVGLHDDFFDLGGHSLLMMRMHQRLRNELGREFPILSLFQNTTVSRLSDFLEGEKGHPEATREFHERQQSQAQTTHRKPEKENTL